MGRKRNLFATVQTAGKIEQMQASGLRVNMFLPGFLSARRNGQEKIPSERLHLFWVWCVAAVFSTLGSLTAFAAAKAISSVSISVSSDLETGSSLPTIEWGSSSSSASSGGVTLSVSSDRYYISDAEWTTSTSRDVEVGDTPQMKVWLTPADADVYQFKGSYHSSNVTVKRGTFVKANKSGDDLIVYLKVRAVKGDFSEPEEAYWKDHAKGTAKWTAPDDNGTGKYEVVLKRGSSTVTRVETTSKTYNFYPYMTVAGTYSFKVRTIAKTSKEEDYGTKSGWTESDEIYISEEDVSDGSGQSQEDSSTTVNAPGGSSAANSYSVGWIWQDSGWYFRYPDGSYQKDGWGKVNDHWYLFDADGRMKTGWQLVNGNYYYFGSDGAMVTGWLQLGDYRYYLNPYPDQYMGIMFADTAYTIDGKDYYFRSDGSMAEGWCSVNGNWCYFYPGSGEKAKNVWVDGFWLDQDGNWNRTVEIGVSTQGPAG